MKVFVYYNLHKKCWSIKYKGLVIAHSHSVYLKDVRFKVSEAGRQRVLKEKRKNIHAGAHGTLVSYGKNYRKGKRQVSYNPYKYGYFYDKADMSPVQLADEAKLINGQVWI